MIPIRYISPAQGEVADAVERFMAEESYEVADRFYAELDRVLEMIAAYPQVGRMAEGDSRKVTMSHFPYDVIYKLVQGEAVIYALANHNRKPGYWLDRL